MSKPNLSYFLFYISFRYSYVFYLNMMFSVKGSFSHVTKKIADLLTYINKILIIEMNYLFRQC